MKETSDVSNKKYYVYVILSLKDLKLYIGYTTNLKERLISHALGKNIATKNRRPLKLIYYEYFVNLADAKSREVFLKSGGGHLQLKKLMPKTLQELKYKFL
ncbi:MAG: GIY-YIG nuclease family protein [Candidatus Curtissbacteria bacterium]